MNYCNGFVCAFSVIDTDVFYVHFTLTSFLLSCTLYTTANYNKHCNVCCFMHHLNSKLKDNEKEKNVVKKGKNC